MITVGVLCVLAATAVLCLFLPRRWNAIMLALCSALWLPANNGHLEGEVLYVVDAQHGLTSSDLISYGGFLLAAITMLRWSRSGTRRRALAAGGSIAGMVALAGASMTATWLLQPY